MHKIPTTKKNVASGDENVRSSIFSFNGRTHAITVSWGSPGGEGGEDSYRAWHFFCIRIIQIKVTSHLVQQRATSPAGAKTKLTATGSSTR